MVDVEERALRPLEEHRLPGIHGFIHDQGRIDDVALQAIGIPHVLLVDLFQFETVDFVQLLKQPIDIDQIFFQLLLEERRIEQIAHANADPRHFVAVGRADPTPSGSNTTDTFRLLRGFIDFG